MLKRFTASTFATAVTALAAVSMTSTSSLAEDAKVVELTQTACQFVEVEDKDHGYKSTKKADCEAINAKTADERLKTAKVMTLKPGKHVFRVTNKNVPYGLGFYLRGAGVSRLTLPKVSGGGLEQGVSKDYSINLTPGTYYFSCPLNTTPDYTIKVEG
ncbi:MAG: hypothetical protein HKP56_00420 [Anderseniella sp.]|nr:hypothetical protein [Anderseniella sp.]